MFVFDEAHLLFADAPASLRRRVEQVVRLIRSKGVGVYFCSQNPDDIPNEILGQLGNRVQHALRAFTPRDQKAIRSAAETFVPRPGLNVLETLTSLAVGEALVSPLGDKGVPQPVEKTLIAPPRCRMGPLSAEERAQIRARSPVGAKYDTTMDRESAYEVLKKQAELAAEAAAAEAAKAAEDKAAQAAARQAAPRRSSRQTTGEAFIKSTVRTVGNSIGREISRNLMGVLFNKKR